MRITLYCLCLFVFLSCSVLNGVGSVCYAQTIVTKHSNSEKLKTLFETLKRSKSEAIASDLANDIRHQWVQSGSATVDLLMKSALQAMNRRDYGAAMDFLDQVVTLKPDYAEGWNRRATLHFTMNNYSKSMLDIEKTLELEPRHFGALAGMGMIFLSLNRKERALLAYQRALEIYPLMRDVQKIVGELEDQMAGSRI